MSVLEEMAGDLLGQISPHIEHIKFLQGHGEHKGWNMKTDKDGDLRFRCGCGVWIDDKEEAESDS